MLIDNLKYLYVSFGVRGSRRTPWSAKPLLAGLDTQARLHSQRHGVDVKHAKLHYSTFGVGERGHSDLLAKAVTLCGSSYAEQLWALTAAH